MKSLKVYVGRQGNSDSVDGISVTAGSGRQKNEWVLSLASHSGFNSGIGFYPFEWHQALLRKIIEHGLKLEFLLRVDDQAGKINLAKVNVEQVESGNNVTFVCNKDFAYISSMAFDLAEVEHDLCYIVEYFYYWYGGGDQCPSFGFSGGFNNEPNWKDKNDKQFILEIPELVCESEEFERGGSFVKLQERNVIFDVAMSKSGFGRNLKEVRKYCGGSKIKVKAEKKNKKRNKEDFAKRKFQNNESTQSEVIKLLGDLDEINSHPKVRHVSYDMTDPFLNKVGMPLAIHNCFKDLYYVAIEKAKLCYNAYGFRNRRGFAKRKARHYDVNEGVFTFKVKVEKLKDYLNKGDCLRFSYVRHMINMAWKGVSLGCYSTCEQIKIIEAIWRKSYWYRQNIPVSVNIDGFINQDCSLPEDFIDCVTLESGCDSQEENIHLKKLLDKYKEVRINDNYWLLENGVDGFPSLLLWSNIVDLYNLDLSKVDGSTKVRRRDFIEACCYKGNINKGCLVFEDPVLFIYDMETVYRLAFSKNSSVDKVWQVATLRLINTILGDKGVTLHQDDGEVISFLEFIAGIGDEAKRNYGGEFTECSVLEEVKQESEKINSCSAFSEKKIAACGEEGDSVLAIERRLEAVNSALNAEKDDDKNLQDSLKVLSEKLRLENNKVNRFSKKMRDERFKRLTAEVALDELKDKFKVLNDKYSNLARINSRVANGYFSRSKITKARFLKASSELNKEVIEVRKSQSELEAQLKESKMSEASLGEEKIMLECQIKTFLDAVSPEEKKNVVKHFFSEKNKEISDLKKKVQELESKLDGKVGETSLDKNPIIYFRSEKLLTGSN